MNFFVYFLFYHFFKLLSAEILYESSSCTTHDSAPGICKKIRECDEAYKVLKRNKFHHYRRCSLLNFTEIVCCPVSTITRSLNMTTRISKKACDAFYPNNDEPLTPLITGGDDVIAGEFPFVTALGLYNEAEKYYHFECGGTLISEKFVLTAAHCLNNHLQENVTVVRLGVIDIPFKTDNIDEKIDYKIKNRHIPSNFHKYTNDIGLIELEKIVEFKFGVKPACLLTKLENFPTEFIILGWGATDSDNNRKHRLQKAWVHFHPHQNCSKRYKDKYNKYLQKTQLCALSKTSDSCMGDSGGPLISRKENHPVIVGIVSYGESGCFVGRASIYTNVYHYLDFIENIVWPSGTL